MVKVEELECGCCYELLNDPTTLNCGHSFCRYCLGKWYGVSNKTECPECRQIWTGFPKVNVHLRTIIEKLYPEEIAIRKQTQKSSEDYNETLQKFDCLASKRDKGSETIDVQQMMQFVFGIILLVALVVLVIALLAFLYYLFLSGPKTSEVIFNKPADKWTTAEVSAWIQVITGQFEQDYSGSFSQAKVEGSLLLSLTEEDLASPPLNISNALHRKILATAITKLSLTRVKKPTNLWEYKKAHSSNALFLLFMVQEYPRFTFLYLHYMEYHTIFLPFLYEVIGTSGDCETTLQDDNTTCTDYHPSTKILLKFYLGVILFPFVLVSQFAARYTNLHFLTMWIIISHCLMLTFGELAQLPKRPPIRDLPRHLVSSIVSFILTCIWYWSILSCTPSFICDIVFYSKLFYGPIDTANDIRSGDLRSSIVWKVLSWVVRTCEGLWRFFRFFLNPRNA